MPQNTNLNKSPYFADFDPNDDYYKILFKPGVTVQTRELTNLQSTLQNQIETFGKSVYSNTIAVNGGGYKYISNFECVQLESTYNGIDVEDYYNNLKYYQRVIFNINVLEKVCIKLNFHINMLKIKKVIICAINFYIK